MTASYTLGDAKSTIGTAVDELNANNLQEAELLYDDPRVFGPTTRNSRHSGTFSAVWQAKGFTVSPIYIFRSPGAIATIPGVDTNRNGENNDLTARAFSSTASTATEPRPSRTSARARPGTAAGAPGARR